MDKSITERNKESLQGIATKLLPNLMHNLPGMAYRCKDDSKWTMVFISEGCYDLTGYAARELIDNATLSYDELIIDEDKDHVRHSVNLAVAKRTQFQMEYRIRTKDGSIKWVWEKGNAVYDAQKKPVYLDGFITDVSSRRKAEEDLKRAARDLAELNATKDRFFSLIAHDLQNPVYAIISLSEFLEENHRNFTQDEIEDFLKQINSAGRGIYTLLENLLDWARLQTGKIFPQKELFSVSKATRYAMEHFAQAASQKDIKLELIGDEDYMVESDMRLVSSILRNLISNAIKFSHAQSKVSVQIGQDGDWVAISVTDKGIGISRRDLSRIFNIDNDLRHVGTANEPGSGLGLILTDSFADLLGAKVKAESKLNHGSKFTLLIQGRI